MTTDSMPPPTSSGGGNVKYVIVGVLLLLGAGGLFLALGGKDEAPRQPIAALPDAGQRSTALAQPLIEIPDEEPDSGPPVDAGRKVRIVYKYVGGGGDWSCQGDIPAPAVQSVMQENRAQVRNCYERRLKVNNSLAGTVNVALKIGSNGSVEATRVGGSLSDNEVFSCVRSLAGRWRFPAPSGGACAVVQVPFNLSPRSP